MPSRVSCERDGKVKRFTAVFGHSKNPRAWITPNTSDLRGIRDGPNLLELQPDTLEVRWASRGEPRAVEDVGVDHCRGYIRVTEKLLDRANIVVGGE